MSESKTATKMVDDLDDYHMREIAEEFSKLVPKAKHLGKFNSCHLYNSGDDSNGKYFLISPEGKCIYFSVYRKVNASKMRLGRQILIWADPDENRFVAGAAKFVFFEHLLPRFKVLCTDTQQSKDGQRFWLLRIRDAFDQGLHVYCLDRRKTPTSLEEIADYLELDKFYEDIWGHDDGHLRTHAVISSTPLSLKGN